ncbi:uncharacterized protein LOC134283608 [Saccostrea cucullata]|uniref:uncharacterized protein LOC134283608 n=1 Tax=Saccostrea cuccullata TaxID=36930 RepID=UPI002ED43066
MNALIVLASVLVSCYAGRNGDGGYGGVKVGGLVGLLEGRLLGGRDGGFGGRGGGLGERLGGIEVAGGGRWLKEIKYGTCPSVGETDSLQVGRPCSNDEYCPGSQKCCLNNNYGRRCQIPIEYQKPGRGNTFLMMYTSKST